MNKVRVIETCNGPLPETDTSRLLLQTLSIRVFYDFPLFIGFDVHLLLYKAN